MGLRIGPARDLHGGSDNKEEVDWMEESVGGARIEVRHV